MTVEKDNNYVCLTHDNYMLVVYPNGAMCEGIVTANSIRTTLNAKEKRIISGMWKAFLEHDY